MNRQKFVIAPPALRFDQHVAASVAALCPDQPSQHDSGAPRHLLLEEPDYGCVDWFMYGEASPDVDAGKVASSAPPDARP